jgi:Wax ester synthase-like Acyl-CoA acyltransferase domain
MKQLTGLDALFLELESPEMPMHVGSLNIYELPAGIRGSLAAQRSRADSISSHWTAAANS